MHVWIERLIEMLSLLHGVDSCPPENFRASPELQFWRPESVAVFNFGLGARNDWNKDSCTQK